MEAPSGSTVSDRKLKIAFIGARGVVGTYSGFETYYEEVGSRLVSRPSSRSIVRTKASAV